MSTKKDLHAEPLQDGYHPVSLKEAYKLIVPGQPVLVASRGQEQYNLAPIAWNCPLDYDPVTKVLFVCDPAHQTAANIKRTGQFALCIPDSPDDPLIQKCGSVSDPHVDKFGCFNIGWFKATETDLRIPERCTGWIECRLIKVIPEGSVEIFLGEAVAAGTRDLLF
jgi:Conserved protein/domain typically associated with flavoprotein oxygenases, DIM6/NTAB family